MNQALKIITAVIITAAIVGGGMYVWQKKNQRLTTKKYKQDVVALQSQIKQIQVKLELAMEGTWESYIYKNMSLMHPKDWIVVFDSKVFGQPNGFSLHIVRKGDESSYQPRGFWLSTYNNRRGTPTDYVPVANKRFDNDEFISFIVANTKFYASCWNPRSDSTLDICNIIASTVTIE